MGPFNGYVSAINLHRLEVGGGSVTVNLTGPGIADDLVSTGPSLLLQVTGGRVGSVTAAGTLAGLGPWAVTRDVGRITAGAIAGLDLTAGWLGPVTVTGSRRFGIAGDVRQSTLRTTGPGGLASLTAAGDVVGSTIDVKGGNVGAVTVRRFLGSRLYVNYTPAGAFNTGGAFDTGATYFLSSFTTTAPAGPGAADGHWAFEDSEVAAPVISVVRLTGLKTANGGTAFGFKSGLPFSSVTVGSADDAAVPPNIALTPSSSALAGDFFLMRG
jgi:hypothetical protein